MKYEYTIGLAKHETENEAEYRYWREAESAYLKGRRHDAAPPQIAWEGSADCPGDHCRSLREAAPTSAFAPVTRKRPSHFGAPDSSGSVARVAQARLAEHDEDVPLDSVKSDLKRKKALHAIMPGQQETILDDLLDGGDCDDSQKDANGNCPGDENFDAETAGEYLATERESGYGMSQGVTGPLTEAPDGLSGKELGAWASDNGVKLPPDDPLVNLRYMGSQPVAPGSACSNCVYFDKDAGSCEIVANPVTPVLLCSMWTPAEGEGKALESFRQNYRPKGNR